MYSVLYWYINIFKWMFYDIDTFIRVNKAQLHNEFLVGRNWMNTS